MLFLAKMIRLCSDNVHNAQNLLRPFRQGSECSDSSDNVPTLFKQYSESVQHFSEFLAQN